MRNHEILEYEVGRDASISNRRRPIFTGELFKLGDKRRRSFRFTGLCRKLIARVTAQYALKDTCDLGKQFRQVRVVALRIVIFRAAAFAAVNARP